MTFIVLFCLLTVLFLFAVRMAFFPGLGRVGRLAAAVLFLGMTALTLGFSAESIPSGHVGLVYTFGAITDQRPEGLQWVAPWRDVKPASIQTQGRKFEKMTAFSIETQSVTVTATINIRVLPAGIQGLYRDVGADYFNVLIQPRVLQAFKDETVNYSSIDVAPKRDAIRIAVRDVLIRELSGHSIEVQDLLIDDISFGDKFEAAIEEKQTQSQLALAEKEKVGAEKAKADQELEKARGSAGAILITAEKQAEANRKLTESLSPTLIQYIFATKLSPNVNVMMVPSGQNFILDANVLSPAKK